MDDATFSTGLPTLDDRTDPPVAGPERAMLEAWLEYHRTTLLAKCSGLSAEQLRTRSVPPSSLSLLGLVRHLTDVERTWFRHTFQGEDLPALYWSRTDPDGDFDGVDGADPEVDLGAYRAEVAACRAVAAEHQDLDALSRTARHGEHVSLRWVYVHLIEEYARHNGHADLLRERLDGATGD